MTPALYMHLDVKFAAQFAATFAAAFFAQPFFGASVGGLHRAETGT